MSRLFFWNLERLRLLVAVLILGISAMTVSSILSILPVTPARMLLQTEPVATVKNPKPTAVARMVYYKMFGDDNQLETVRLQDSTLKRRRRQLLWNADTLGEKGVPEEGSLRDEDDDEGLFFYPNVSHLLDSLVILLLDPDCVDLYFVRSFIQFLAFKYRDSTTWRRLRLCASSAQFNTVARRKRPSRRKSFPWS